MVQEGHCTHNTAPGFYQTGFRPVSRPEACPQPRGSRWCKGFRSIRQPR